MNFRILLIEDNEGDAFFFEELLRQIPAFKFSLTVATRLKAGIESLRSEKFDIVFTDLGLPDSMGLDTLKALHELDKIIPIVVLTGLNDEEKGFQALSFGAQDYLIKGEFTADQIYRVIRYSIGRNSIQEKFVDSERRFRMLFESSPIGIGIIDKDGNFESLNEFGQDILDVLLLN